MSLSNRWSDRAALWLIKIGLAQAAIGVTVLALTAPNVSDVRAPFVQHVSPVATTSQSTDVQAFELSRLESLNIGDRLMRLEMQADEATRTAAALKTQISDATQNTDHWLYGLMTTLVLQLGATGVMVKGQRSKRLPEQEDIET